jgi:2-polyprenyl-3-methyl-5-hydroxy-6-metoxy-1,4-benzoquinol methylase
MSLPYVPDSTGIHRPSTLVKHRDEEYDQSGFDTLFKMQKKHFWYRGRHKFLCEAVDRHTRNQSSPLYAVDLGGGVGGWVSYLADRRADRFQSIALADSSDIALTLAKNVLPTSAQLYQIDLMNLGWENQWDCVFLLDVIEHLPNYEMSSVIIIYFNHLPIFTTCTKPVQ